jgi:glucokinase
VLSKRMTPDQLIGVDVGGTKIAISLVDMKGQILASMRRPTDVSKPEATLDSIANTVKEFAGIHHLDLQTFEAIGFGIPGLVDAEKGIGIASVNLGWENVPVRAGLENRLGVACVIDNDVRTGALGEARFGAARGLKNLVYLNIGTGVSAVILLEGKFFLGVNGLAGEIGHAILVPDGPVCKCGGRGCFEAVASGPGMVEWTLKKINGGRVSLLSQQVLKEGLPLTVENIFSAAEKKDEVALETLKEIGALMAHSLEYLALAYDPNMIAIGGSVVLESPLLYQIIQQKLEELADASWVFRKVYSKELVKRSTLGNNAGVLGAAALAAPVT